MSIHFTGAGRSDDGSVRDNNEDSGFLGPHLALVADGVGGASAGEVASTLTALTVANRLRRWLMLPPGRRSPLAEAMPAAVQAAQKALADDVRRRPEHAGLATTLTALATDGRRVVLAHVGDSRGYLLHHGRLVPITTDHTFVRQLVEERRITKEQAAEHPWRNLVTRTVNGLSADLPDVGVIDARPGDRILLATDGLTDLVGTRRIHKILGLGDPALAADRLVRDAINRGGHDNITCLVVDVATGPAPGGPGDLPGCFLGAAAEPGTLRRGTPAA